MKNSYYWQLISVFSAPKKYFKYVGNQELPTTIKNYAEAHCNENLLQIMELADNPKSVQVY